MLGFVRRRLAAFAAPRIDGVPADAARFAPVPVDAVAVRGPTFDLPIPRLPRPSVAVLRTDVPVVAVRPLLTALFTPPTIHPLPPDRVGRAAVGNRARAALRLLGFGGVSESFVGVIEVVGWRGGVRAFLLAKPVGRFTRRRRAGLVARLAADGPVVVLVPRPDGRVTAAGTVGGAVWSARLNPAGSPADWAAVVADRLARRPDPPPADPDQLYWDALSPWPVLDRGESDRLLAVVRAGPSAGWLDARNRLLLGHWRLARSGVGHYRLGRPGGSMTDADRMQAAFFGLARAVERFDPGFDTTFATYAYPWVRQAVQRAKVTTDRLIRIPAYRYASGRRLPPAEFRRLTRIRPLGGHDRPAADPPGEPGDEARAAVAAALRVLTPRQREVVVRRFGLDGERSETLRELGDRFAVTRERVRQIEAEALKRLAKEGSLRAVYEGTV